MESEILTEMRAGSRERGPTPDVLFLHPVRINGRLVKWIDAKLYYTSMTYVNCKKIPNEKLVNIARRCNQIMEDRAPLYLDKVSVLNFRRLF